MILKTKIQLRNDTAAKWKAANPLLGKGEMGIEIDTGLIKIGTGIEGDNWNNLPYINDVVSHTTTVTSEAARKALTGMVSGDVCIVKQPIAGDKYSYTCYVYDAQSTATDKWIAADGNYSADNVILKSDLTLTGPAGAITADMISKNGGSYTVTAEGLNIETVLKNIFAERKQPTIKSYPYVSINKDHNYTYFTLPGSSTKLTAVEAGTSPDLHWTSSFGKGSYSYQAQNADGQAVANDSGVRVNTITATFDGRALTSALTGTINIATLTDDAGAKTSATLTIKVNHTAGYKALDNLGSLSDPVVQIVGGDKTATHNLSIYRKCFGGGLTDMSAATSDIIRNLPYSDQAYHNKTLYFNAAKGNTRVLVAFPSKCKPTGQPNFEYFTMSWGPVGGFNEVANVSVADARGGANDPITYRVFEYLPAGPFAALTKFRVTF